MVTYVLAQDHIKSCFLSRVSLISCSKKQLFMVDIVGISLAYEQIKIDIVIDELCFLFSQLQCFSKRVGGSSSADHPPWFVELDNLHISTYTSNFVSVVYFC